MKLRTLIFIVGITALAGPAQATALKSELLTECKYRVKQALGDNTRVKLKRFRGATTIMRVTPKGEKSVTVSCKVERSGEVLLSYDDGRPLHQVSQVETAKPQ